MDVVGLAVELDQLALEVRAHRAEDLFQPGRVGADEDRVPVLSDENQVSVKHENAVSAGANVPVACREPPVR